MQKIEDIPHHFSFRSGLCRVYEKEGAHQSHTLNEHAKVQVYFSNNISEGWIYVESSHVYVLFINVQNVY